MCEQLGFFVPLWRLAAGLLGATVFLDSFIAPAGRSFDLQLVLVLVTFGLTCLGYEVYRRRVRLRLSLTGDSVHISRRGVPAGSFGMEALQPATTRKVRRELLRACLVSAVTIMTGALLVAIDLVWLGAVISCFGTLSLAAAIHDYRRLWTVEGSQGKDIWRIRLKNADVQALLGYRPGTRPAPPARARVRRSPGVQSHIALKKIADTGSFARFEPFRDGRHVIVRRERELGFEYGREVGRRTVEIVGGEFDVVCYQGLLTRPVTKAEAIAAKPDTASYKPICEVLYLPDAEVLVPREPKGFNDAEVRAIMHAIRIVQSSPEAGVRLPDKHMA